MQEFAAGCEQRHVAFTSNPLDISQGTNPETLKHCRLWWLGLEWLNQHPKQWPTNRLAKHPGPTPEQHEIKTVKVIIQHFPTDLIKFSVL